MTTATFKDMSIIPQRERDQAPIPYFPQSFSAFARFLVLPCVSSVGDVQVLVRHACFNGYDADDDAE